MGSRRDFILIANDLLTHATTASYQLAGVVFGRRGEPLTPRQYELSVLSAALVLPVALLSLALLARLAAPPFVILRTVPVILGALTLSATLLALVALPLV